MTSSCRNLGLIQTPPEAFLKWAGGKRWLCGWLAPLLNNPDGAYFEPFVGGGSTFFSVQCRSSVLSDINPDLMNTYRVVRDSVDELIRLLRCLSASRRLFARIRRERCRHAVTRAARFIYLNKTAFNGLFRVNKQGQFNVPFGCKRGTQICEEGKLLACSAALQKAVLLTADFRSVLEAVSPQDTVFVDPPYTVKHDNNGFRHYNERIFSWEDQVDLAAHCCRLAKQGASVVVTNACHAEVNSLYQKNLFRSFVASRATNMAASAEARGTCRELVLISHSLANFEEKLPFLRTKL